MITQGHKRRIIRVTPTLDPNPYAEGDVLFTATEIPGATMGLGECSKLIAVYCLSQAHGNADDLDVYFTEGTTALGSINATANISDSDLEAIGFCGLMRLDASDGVTVGLDTAKINQLIPLPTIRSSPILLQAAAGSSSVYFQAVLNSATTPTYAADDLDFIFHIEF